MFHVILNLGLPAATRSTTAAAAATKTAEAATTATTVAVKWSLEKRQVRVMQRRKDVLWHADRLR